MCGGVLGEGRGRGGSRRGGGGRGGRGGGGGGLFGWGLVGFRGGRAPRQMGGGWSRAARGRAVPCVASAGLGMMRARQLLLPAGRRRGRLPVRSRRRGRM